MLNGFLKRLGWFLVVLALQVLVFDHVHILGHATPLVAVYFVLSFPGDSSRAGILLWSFVFGLIADTFTDTPGVTAVTLTTLGMLQPWLLKVNSAIENDDDIPVASARVMGWGAYVRYVSIGVILAEAIFYTLEAFSFFNGLELLLNASSSALLTILIIVAIESLLAGGKKSAE